MLTDLGVSGQVPDKHVKRRYTVCGQHPDEHVDMQSNSNEPIALPTSKLVLNV